MIYFKSFFNNFVENFSKAIEQYKIIVDDIEEKIKNFNELNKRRVKMIVKLKNDKKILLNEILLLRFMNNHKEIKFQMKDILNVDNNKKF